LHASADQLPTGATAQQQERGVCQIQPVDGKGVNHENGHVWGVTWTQRYDYVDGSARAINKHFINHDITTRVANNLAVRPFGDFNESGQLQQTKSPKLAIGYPSKSINPYSKCITSHHIMKFTKKRVTLLVLSFKNALS
jgi:hypothetical protein